MTMAWPECLRRPVGAEDQPPGTYRYRAKRGAPWQPLRILYDGVLWHCLLTGKPVPGSGTLDPMDIPMIRDRGPFHAIDWETYTALIAAYEGAPPGTPLATPNEAVDLRRSRPL